MLNIDESFWNEHSSLKAAGPFKELYTKDKSRNKAASSKLAWTILLIWDRKSEFYRLEENEKIALVFEDYFGDSSYYTKNKAKVDELKEFYQKINESVASRTLRGIEDKLLERDRFLRNTPYDMGVVGERGGWVGNTVDTIDKMMANTEKLYGLYDKARKTVEEEDQRHAMGDQTESLTDKGEI